MKTKKQMILEILESKQKRKEVKTLEYLEDTENCLHIADTSQLIALEDNSEDMIICASQRKLGNDLTKYNLSLSYFNDKGCGKAFGKNGINKADFLYGVLDNGIVLEQVADIGTRYDKKLILDLLHQNDLRDKSLPLLKIYPLNRKHRFLHDGEIFIKESLDPRLLGFIKKSRALAGTHLLSNECRFEFACVSFDHQKIYKYTANSNRGGDLRLENTKTMNCIRMVEGECVYETKETIIDFKMVSFPGKRLHAIYLKSGEIQLGRFIDTDFILEKTFHLQETFPDLQIKNEGHLFFSDSQKLLISRVDTQTIVLLSLNEHNLGISSVQVLKSPVLKNLKMSLDGKYLYGINLKKENRIWVIDLNTPEKKYEITLSIPFQDIVITARNHLYSIDKLKFTNHKKVEDLLLAQDEASHRWQCNMF